MLSVTAQHAIRALAALASEFEDRPILGRDLSQVSGVPQNYLSKILRELNRAGLVSAVRGSGGGYRLRRPAHEITLSDVVYIFDPSPTASGCLLGEGNKCSDVSPCSVHDRWCAVREGYASFLENTRLSEIAHD
ncbi:MAG: Rrf2 family transcriptional regulator, partial [bacterium]|nr:Rrf2 family transcriptional regulator [bacterium]